jgi:carbonic anhydrase
MQQSYNKLFENNRKYVDEKVSADPEYFVRMAEDQRPKYLFIGCSDSRVPANELTGTGAGEMFVHRNIANLVVHTDMNLMSVLQYSVEILKVEHIIVCGHYGCGGVKAATDNTHHGLIDKWLRNIVDVYRTHRAELDAVEDDRTRHERLVELSVREQVYNLAMTSIVQKAWLNGQFLQVHGWVYNMHTGFVTDLSVDVENDFSDFDLYRYKEKVKLS